MPPALALSLWYVVDPETLVLLINGGVGVGVAAFD
jgi:hypothetical protein